MPGKAPSHLTATSPRGRQGVCRCAKTEVCKLTWPRWSIHLPCAARLLGPGRVESSASTINGRHAHSRCANARTPVRQASAGDCAMCGYAPGEQGRYHGRLPPPEDRSYIEDRSRIDLTILKMRIISYSCTQIQCRVVKAPIWIVLGGKKRVPTVSAKNVKSTTFKWRLLTI